MTDDTDTGHPVSARLVRSKPAAVAGAGAIGMAAVLAWALSFLVLNVVGLGLTLAPSGHSDVPGSVVVGAVRIVSVAGAGGLIWVVILALRRVGVVRPVAAGLCGVVGFLAWFMGIAATEVATGLHSAGWVETGVASFLGFAAAARVSHRPRWLLVLAVLGVVVAGGAGVYLAA